MAKQIPPEVSEHFREIGRRGGLKKRKYFTPEQQREAARRKWQRQNAKRKAKKDNKESPV